ncbi:MAG: RNA polymerase sigma factor [Micromonosporaceae bacterium]
MPGPWSDAELVRGAQSGDAGCLGSLLQRHLAGMHAVALSILGAGPDAEDAVQDTMLVALRRITEVRDPGAVGAWLRTIVRNSCRMRLRRRRPAPLTDAVLTVAVSGEPTPEALLERQALRDWVWHALEELSEPLRLVTMLRYFSEVSSYQEIAAVCGVPVGTVRSRLCEARRRLTGALLATENAAHRDTVSLARSRRAEAEHLLAEAERGAFAAAAREHWSPEAEVIGPQPDWGRDLDFLIRAMRADQETGVRQRIVNVVASSDLTILEAQLLSPADDPQHCPPGVVWLQSVRGGRVWRSRLFHGRTAAAAG